LVERKSAARKLTFSFPCNKRRSWNSTPKRNNGLASGQERHREERRAERRESSARREGVVFNSAIKTEKRKKSTCTGGEE